MQFGILSKRKNMDNNQLIRKKNELIDSLRKKGIKDENVLKAIRKIPRELFVLDDYLSKTYEDIALPLICGQTISQPYTVAFMTQLLQITPSLKVLEIGTGSGYQSSILAEMGCKTYSIERIPELYEFSKERIKKLNYEVVQKIDDGTKGWKEFAPFDRILVTAAAPQAPLSLLSQIDVGGFMIIPIGDKSSQMIKRITRKSEIQFETEEFDYFRFVPLIGEQGWEK